MEPRHRPRACRGSVTPSLYAGPSRACLLAEVKVCWCDETLLNVIGEVSGGLRGDRHLGPESPHVGLGTDDWCAIKGCFAA